MRIRLLCTGLLWAILPLAGWAQPDTLTFDISEAVEINDSLENRLSHDSHETRFERDSLGLYPTSGISVDALLRQVEGLYVRNYGGHGGVKTLSVRGFSSQQTTVTINGLPYRNPQSGVVNFGNFFPDGYGSISVNKSAHNPAINPLGGNVNFEVEPDKTGVRVKLGAGSFGEWQAALGADYKRKRTAIRASYQHLQALDNYPFSLNGEEGIREHAAFQTQQYQVFIEQGFKGGLQLSYLATGYFNKQEVPGPVLTGNPVSEDGSLKENDHYYFVQLEKKNASLGAWPPFRSMLSVSYHYNYLEYDWQNRPDEYTNHDLLVQLQTEQVWRKQKLTVDLQYNPAWLSGNNLAIDFSPVPSVQRQQVNLGLGHRIFLPLDSLNPGRQISFETTLRANYLEAYGLLPNVGINAVYRSRKGSAEYFSHFHYGHRIPSFNELYYFGYGNSDLKPERVSSVDVGAWWNFRLLLPFSLKTSMFYNQTLDKIISIPINPARWSTLSIGKARSYGLEFSMKAQLGKSTSVYASYTRQEAHDLTREEEPYLPYTPPELASYGVETQFGGLGIQLNGAYSGWRFSLLDNGAGSYLPPYNLLDASMSYTTSLKGLVYRVMIQAENITNVNYEVVKSYPMPPRSIRVVIIMKY